MQPGPDVPPATQRRPEPEHAHEHEPRDRTEGIALVLTYTSCATCDGSMVVDTGPGTGTYRGGYHNTHPDCPQPTDRHNRLRRQYLESIEDGEQVTADRLADQLDALDSEPPQLLRAALAYASWGWPVFPLRAGAKTPLTTHGVNDAGTDALQIAHWWNTWPRANIGLATGHAFDVIDIDPHGVRWWAELVADHAGPGGPLPDMHAIASTPRGRHVYIEPSGRGNLAGLHDGVDYRGHGGYVVAPPSVLNPAVYPADNLPPRPAPLRYTWSVYPSPWIRPASGGAT